MPAAPSRCFRVVPARWTLLAEADRALRVLSGNATAGRPNPASAEELPTALSDKEKRHAAGLMRVNHVGESAPRRCIAARRRSAANPPPVPCCWKRRPKRSITWSGAISA